MRWRRLFSRTRDLGLLFLAAEHFWAGLSGWLTLIAGIAFAAIVTAAMASAATTHAKAVSTENRLNALIPVLGGITGQQGKGSSLSFPNLSQTETGAVQYNGSDPAVTGTADVGTTSSNGSPAHTHSFGGHRHPEGHYHFTQIAPDYNNLMTTLNQMKADLQAAGIL